jgi:hypothetical protein
MGQLTMVSVGPLYKLGIQPGPKPRIGARRWVRGPGIPNHVPGSARRVVFSKGESELMLPRLGPRADSKSSWQPT